MIGPSSGNVWWSSSPDTLLEIYLYYQLLFIKRGEATGVEKVTNPHLEDTRIWINPESNPRLFLVMKQQKFTKNYKHYKNYTSIWAIRTLVRAKTGAILTKIINLGCQPIKQPKFEVHLATPEVYAVRELPSGLLRYTLPSWLLKHKVSYH